MVKLLFIRVKFRLLAISNLINAGLKFSMDNYRSPTLSNQQVYFQHPTFNVNRKYLDSFHQVKLIKLLFYVGECFPAILLDPIQLAQIFV